MAQEATPLFAPRRVFAALALVCLVGIIIIAFLGRGRAPAIYAAGAMVVIATLCLVLARTWVIRPDRTRHVLQVATLIILSLGTAPIGWFFGPNSAFSAVIALVLVVAGLVTGGSEVRHPTVGGWLVFATIAGGQAVVTFLALTGTLPDASLLAVAPPGHPTWHHASAHAALQIIYFTAFIAGREFHVRYRRLSKDLDAAIQVAARREALLEEARAEYQRALAVGRHGIFSGQTIGSFRLGDLIGRGGAGEVYDARDLRDGTIAAVKLMRSENLGDAVEVKRFVAETGMMGRVASPHIVQVREVGGLDASIPYLAMEKLDGIDLGALLAKQGALDRDSVHRLIEDASSALEAVHAAGLSHGDVSPKNLILTDGRWKLIDFGATRSSRDSARLLGTPRFIAPESITGARSDPRADLYSLAACVYAAVTGSEPFAEIAAGGLAHATASRAPQDPRLRGEVSEAVAQALQIGLAKSPDDRFADAGAFRIAFVAALAGAPDPSIAARSTQLTAWSVSPPAVEWETTEADAKLPAPPLAPAVPPAQQASLDATRSAAWQLAFRDKHRRQRAGVLALCLGGGVLLGAIVREPAALWAAWVGIGAIAVTVFVQRSTATWPWVIVGGLSVGPAFALGLHSAFAAVIALVLFAGGLFRTRAKTEWWNNEWLILSAILVSHTLAYAAIATGVIGDLGNTPTRYATAPPGTGPFLHGVLLLIYTAAFAAARTIDRRYGDLVRRNELATLDAAQKEALLATARTELDRALSGETGGLFTGTKVGGFAVERLLGRGGMGEVYEAQRDGERVALKVIRADRISNPDTLRRFSREASTLRLVESPYVARVLEVGADERLPYLAMELVEGVSLAELMRERERLDLGTLRSMIRDVARGLEDVHRAGVLHRDVKPSNLVLTDTDGARWKLVDFGIARFVDAPTETTGSIVMGTPAFMAPEQLEGKPTDARSDLFSLCVVIYRVLTGSPGWTTESALAAVRRQPIDPCRRTDAPSDLGLALRIGLATAPADRFATGAELAATFDAALDGRLDESVRRRARTILAREPWS